jgi:soluble lytic murein transglycosylase-like protein
VKHLKSLLDRFELPLALAAYNAGENAVRRFGGIPPFRETREYVRHVLGILRAARPSL